MELKVALPVVLGAFLVVLLLQIHSNHPRTSITSYLKSRKLKKKEIPEDFDPTHGICNTIPLQTVVNNHVLSHAQHKTQKKALVTGT